MRQQVQTMGPQGRSARAMRQAGWIVAGGVVVMVAACGPQGPQGPGGAPPPPEVGVMTVTAQRVALTRELPGRTAPWKVAEVRPQVSGLVRERLYDEGSDVVAGTVLYQLDDAPFRARVASAEANVVAAEKAAAQARAELAASEASVVERRAELELARINRGRAESLVADGVESVSVQDRVLSEEKVAEGALRSAEADVQRDAMAIAVADAGVVQARAALEAARIDLDYARITAPISGRIGRSAVTVGGLVTAHQPAALVTIQQLDPIYVDVAQSYGDLLRLRQRLAANHLETEESVVSRVRLVLESGEEYAQEGTLQFREASVDPSTGSVVVRMVFPNPDGVLLPGMFVRAILTDGVDPTGILVPQEAVKRNTKAEPVAMVVGADGKVEQRVIVLERAVGNRWLVSAGLAEGERLVVEGLQRVRHGMTVTVAPLAGMPVADATTTTTGATRQ